MEKVILEWLLVMMIDVTLFVFCVQSCRLYMDETGFKKALVAVVSLFLFSFFTFFSYREFVDVVKRVYPLLPN